MAWYSEGGTIFAFNEMNRPDKPMSHWCWWFASLSEEDEETLAGHSWFLSSLLSPEQVNWALREVVQKSFQLLTNKEWQFFS